MEQKQSGRPSVYTEELALTIIERICSGMSLREICRADDMPARSTVLLWISHDKEGFSGRYAKACMARAYYWADEIVDIADDSTNDYMLRQSKDGEDYEQINPEAIGRSRLRVDARKWLVSKLIPAYSDKPEPTSSDDLVAALSRLADRLPS